MFEPRSPSDTSQDALEQMTRLYARMTGSQRLQRMQQLTVAVNQLALAGLRHRHPSEAQPQLLRRLARIRLGDDVATAVYGGDPPARGP